MNEVADQEAERFRSWLEDVYAGILAQIGGDAQQRGNARLLGLGRFACQATGLGDITFVIDFPRAMRHPLDKVGPIEWQAVQPNKVVQELIRRYYELHKCVWPREI